MKAILAVALLSALALAGCSGGGATVPSQDDEGRYVIHLTSANKFSPSVAKVPVGATVVWVHDGGAPHDVQDDGGGFTSGVAGGMREGDEFEHTFGEAGTHSYSCHIHEDAGMRGKLVVS
jgi:plastocyanin